MVNPTVLLRSRYVTMFIAALVTIATVAEAAPLFPDGLQNTPALTGNLTLEFRALSKAKRDSNLDVDASLVIETSGGPATFKIKVKPRGKSRLARCDFYPLWLDFKKSDLTDTLFEGQNRLKLVTHCSSSLGNKGYVAAELAVYRMLNEITDYSFRVRAINMTYTDSTRDSVKTYPAFLIEHKKSLQRRLGGKIVDKVKPRLSQLDTLQSARLALFQYMIGNTDFSFLQGPNPEECCHNIVPLEISAGDTKRIVPIPYDFDATGFVDVPYAAPIPNLGISRLTQRLYRGYCDHNPHLAETIEYFQSKQPQLTEVVTGLSDFGKLRVKKHLGFIERFYKTILTEKNVKKKLERRCR